jgi:predicted RNA-binding protein with RPS1 domain
MSCDFQLLDELKEIHVVNIVKDYVRDLDNTLKFNNVMNELKEKVVYKQEKEIESSLTIKKDKGKDKNIKYKILYNRNLHVSNFDDKFKMKSRITMMKIKDYNTGCYKITSCRYSNTRSLKMPKQRHQFRSSYMGFNRR